MVIFGCAGLISQQISIEFIFAKSSLLHGLNILCTASGSITALVGLIQWVLLQQKLARKRAKVKKRF